MGTFDFPRCVFNVDLQIQYIFDKFSKLDKKERNENEKRFLLPFPVLFPDVSLISNFSLNVAKSILGEIFRNSKGI